jgi:hypothetical protein
MVGHRCGNEARTAEIHLQTTNSSTGASNRLALEQFQTWNALEGGGFVLWTIFVILLVLWLVGVVSSYTLGGFIHLLLLLALIVLILQLVTGRRPVV